MSYDEVTAKLLREKEQQAAEIERLSAALRGLLNASERHIFSTECQKERDAARAALGEKAESDDGQPDEAEEWASFDPEC